MVRVNRGDGDWTTDGRVLPQFGFIAQAGANEAAITRRDGIISAYAKSPGFLFVDARPNACEGEGQVAAKVVGVEQTGDRRFRLRVDWQVVQPVPPGFRPFVHFVDERSGAGEGILFQAGLNLDPEKLGTVGTASSTGDVTVPGGVGASANIGSRLGLYHRGADGRRLPLTGTVDRTGRARGGSVSLDRTGIHWRPEPPDPIVCARAERLNGTGKVVEFGPVATNGAFRLIAVGANWQLISLPGSLAFEVGLHLNQLNASGRKVTRITATDIGGQTVNEVKFEQDGETVRFNTAAHVFAYRIKLAD